MSSIERKCHALHRIKSMAMPRHLLFVDTETTYKVINDEVVEHKLRLGWACYWRRSYGRHLDKLDWLYFEKAETFWQFVFSRFAGKMKLWILARNLVFDFTILDGWRFLKSAGYKLKFFYSFGGTSLIGVRKKGSSIMFCDTMNWFRESLATTGKRIGRPKIEIDFETCSKKELKAYCRNDVEIEIENFKSFIRFLEGNEIGRLSYTIGSTAMSAYLFGSYKTKIWIHNNEQAIDLERESYKGGRTECFNIGDLRGEYFYIVDVNSLYPFVMSNTFYPVKYSFISHNPSVELLSIFLKSYSCVAEVLIDTKEPVYAVKRDRTIFPIGRFWTVLTTPELKHALQAGSIVQVRKVVIYEQADIFTHYVNKLYRLRLDFKSAGVEVYEQICKLLLNSLYGKFGQKAEQWQKIGSAPNEIDRIELLYKQGENRWYKLRYLLGEVWESCGFEETYNSFPAIAAHVTAYARMYLWSLIQRAGQGNYVYCDTDSLIVNKSGLENLEGKLDETKLGYLKVEDTTENLVINGLKDYSFGTKTVIKGISKKAVRISDNEFKQELWPSFTGILRDRATDGYGVKTQYKTLYREYTKGIINADGSIRPFCLEAVGDDSQSLF